ncbi:MAG: SGNH/GDSL hydrolase family protein [Rhodothermaceae bacterium]|nr:SGNH/GDSL hydrolase family protein [Rhodothermaceae bacterium]MXZ57675.1 SGNH/GDSL hydrolase family protein [Rhodothermaceae bacterium]MYB91335.1 SGNH/GDSL hydrolase family protein [Rhodothermaceae bacterium]MYD68776.1 SGNH/GDSL hydrolase family protein [Rhodothermaceae bacterium]MYG45430.1 SGNH/GDSL hydrolase family protein [Rhodothermaceae bacterium]
MRSISLALFLSLMTIQSGLAQSRIVFLGDSITEAGVNPGGYVTLVADSLQTLDAEIEVLGAGISGNKVPDLLARLDEDVLAHEPTHVVVYIGINDVWHHFEFDHVTGTDPETFEEGLGELIDRVEESGAAVLLCTPSVIGEDTESDAEVNLRLAEYAQLSRGVAQEKNVHLCDLRASLEAYLVEQNQDKVYDGILTTDGVHLNAAGNRFVANFMIQELQSVLGL